jgi:hypothetical protein
MAPAFAHLMRSFQAEPAPWHYTTRFHPMQTSFADEIRGTAARLIAYVVAPALLAILGSALWVWLPAAMDGACARARIIQHDSSDKTVVYEIFRRPLGGRWDVFRWTDADRRTSPIS